VKLDWKAALGLGISALLLWWVFRGEDLGAIWAGIRDARWGYLVAAVGVATFGFAIRAARWGILLTPIAPGIGFRPRFAATCIGFAANNLLPARIGEFARAFALSKVSQASASGAFGSLVVERLLDAVAILGLLVVAVLAPTFPSDATIAGQPIGRAMQSVMVVLGVLLVILILMLLFPKRIVAIMEKVLYAVLPDSVARLLVDTTRAFLDGLTVLQNPKLLFLSLVWSFGFWTWHSWSFWLAFRAFGIEADFVAALFLNAVIAIGVAVPSAPGFIGTFHAAAKVGLSEVYGIADAPTLSFAFGYHLGGFIPVTVMGLYYAWRIGMSFGEVERSEETIEEAVEEAHPEGRSPGEGT
jgi:uncharacterized protein (TIRG00374 family)